MAEEKIQYKENDFDPVNRFIDEQSAIRRSKSFWGYSKSIALILVAIGILAILIAYAFYLYNKKDYLTRVDQVRQKSYERGVSESRSQINQLQSKVSNLESSVKSSQLKIDGLETKNKTLETDNENLQKDFIKSRDEAAKLRTSMLENKEVKFYQKELQKIKEQATKDKISLQTDLIYFIEKSHTLPNGKKVAVKTRWYFKDPSQEKPNLKNCYIDFQTSDLRALELNDKQSDFNYPNYYSDKLKLKKDVFVQIKNEKCNL